jgi:hypothetical protein
VKIISKEFYYDYYKKTFIKEKFDIIRYNSVKTGAVFKHFKGDTYKVILVAKHEGNEKFLVIYSDEKGGTPWARDLEQFLDMTINKDGYILRFEEMTDNIEEVWFNTEEKIDKLKFNIDDGLEKVAHREPNGFVIAYIENDLNLNISNCELFLFLYKNGIIQKYPDYDFSIYKDNETIQILMKEINI